AVHTKRNQPKMVTKRVPLTQIAQAWRLNTMTAMGKTMLARRKLPRTNLAAEEVGVNFFLSVKALARRIWMSGATEAYSLGSSFRSGPEKWMPKKLKEEPDEAREGGDGSVG